MGGEHPGQKELPCKDRGVRLLEPRAWAWARVGERRGGRGTALFMAGAQREPRGVWRDGERFCTQPGYRLENTLQRTSLKAERWVWGEGWGAGEG